MKPTTRVKGPCSIFTGYGKLFTQIAGGLRDKRPIELNALGNTSHDDYPLNIDLTTDANSVGLLVGYPNQIRQLSTRYKILYAMFEASEVPFEWRWGIDEADEVWVPSEFCAQVLGRHSQHQPVVVHPGIDNTVYCRDDRYNNRSPLSMWTGDASIFDKFVIGTAGVMSLRKGLDVMIRAFRLAFPGRDDVVLVIKSRDSRVGIDEMLRVDGGMPLPQVVVIDDDWSEAEMAQFYRSLDLLVLPSRGEGLCMPPLEAAMCGTPSLVTRWSGPLEYIDDDGIFGIDVQDIVRADGIKCNNAHWAEPSLRDLVDKLRAFRDNVPEVKRRYMSWTTPEAVDRFDRGLDAAWKRAKDGHRRGNDPR